MIRGLILALQFLTRIPININIDFSDDNIGKGTFFYPFVGAIIGGLTALLYMLFLPLGKDIGALFALIAMVIITGGLHLDGLADTLDGFLSNRDKEKTLEIMKDSRIGAFGVVGLIIILLCKYVVLCNTVNVPLALVLSLANSRLVVVIIMVYKKTARPGGLGTLFHKSSSQKYLIVSLILYVGILFLLNPKYLIPLLASYIMAEFISYIAYKKIDGVTGDVYGAIIEICESVSLIVFLGVSLWI